MHCHMAYSFFTFQFKLLIKPGALHTSVCKACVTTNSSKCTVCSQRDLKRINLSHSWGKKKRRQDRLDKIYMDNFYL